MPGDELNFPLIHRDEVNSGERLRINDYFSKPVKQDFSLIFDRGAEIRLGEETHGKFLAMRSLPNGQSQSDFFLESGQIWVMNPSTLHDIRIFTPSAVFLVNNSVVDIRHSKKRSNFIVRQGILRVGFFSNSQIPKISELSNESKFLAVVPASTGIGGRISVGQINKRHKNIFYSKLIKS